MIGSFRKRPLPDPQSGVPFRPWMLVHAGSLTALAPHRLGHLEEADAPRRSTLLPWTLAMAGLMAAFFLGTSWSASPRQVAGDSCLAAAPEPAAAPSSQSRHSGPH